MYGLFNSEHSHSDYESKGHDYESNHFSGYPSNYNSFSMSYQSNINNSRGCQNGYC